MWACDVTLKTPHSPPRGSFTWVWKVGKASGFGFGCSCFFCLRLCGAALQAPPRFSTGLLSVNAQGLTAKTLRLEVSKSAAPPPCGSFPFCYHWQWPGPQGDAVLDFGQHSSMSGIRTQSSAICPLVVFGSLNSSYWSWRDHFLARL